MLTLPFTGTGIQVQMYSDSDQEIWWIKQIDHGPAERFKARVGSNVLYRGLPAGSHTLTLIRDTEGMTGISFVRGFIVSGGAVSSGSGVQMTERRVLSAGERKDAAGRQAGPESGSKTEDPGNMRTEGEASRLRRIEIIGDSVAAGAFYYSEGSYWQRESGYEAFGPRLARKLGAQWSCVTASGEGAVRNNGEAHPYAAEHAIDQLQRTFYTRRDRLWDAGKDAPDLIILAYGENDFNDPAKKPDALYFQTHYALLVRKLRELSPKAAIFCITPANAVTARLAWPGLKGAVEELRSGGDDRVFAIDLHAQRDLLEPEDFLDSVHPLAGGHEKIADYLYTQVRELLHW